ASIRHAPLAWKRERCLGSREFFGVGTGPAPRSAGSERAEDLPLRRVGGRSRVVGRGASRGRTCSPFRVRSQAARVVRRGSSFRKGAGGWYGGAGRMGSLL